MIEFENKGGVDALEKLQYHYDHSVYDYAFEILHKYFEPDQIALWEWRPVELL